TLSWPFIPLFSPSPKTYCADACRARVGAARIAALPLRQERFTSSKEHARHPRGGRSGAGLSGVSANREKATLIKHGKWGGILFSLRFQIGRTQRLHPAPARLPGAGAPTYDSALPMAFELFFDQEQRILFARFGPVLNEEALEAIRAMGKRFVERAG